MFRRKLKIIKTQNPKKIPRVLRKKAKPIKKITPAIKKLAEKMVALMMEADGVGLAGPQVGKSLRLFVMSIDNGAIAVVNPKMTFCSDDENLIQEGCLSLPGFWAYISRPKKVKVIGQNLEGEEIEIEGEELMARTLCHEIDHLNGTLFIDRIKPPYKLEERVTEEE